MSRWFSDLGHRDLQISQNVSSFTRDAAQAAFPGGVFHFASTIAGFYFCRNPLGDRRAARLGNLVLNIPPRKAKAVANRDRIRGLFNTHAHQEIRTAKDGCLRVLSEIDYVAVLCFAEVVLSLWHPQR
jgi:hypothetical protein